MQHLVGSGSISRSCKLTPAADNEHINVNPCIDASFTAPALYFYGIEDKITQALFDKLNNLNTRNLKC